MSTRDSSQNRPEIIEPITPARLTVWKRFVEKLDGKRTVVAYGMIVVSSLLLLPALTGEIQGDVSLYKGVADDLLAGTMPYRDRALEYPPYVLPIFLLPRLFGNEHYLDCFVVLAFLADLGVKQLLYFLGTRQMKGLRALLPLALYCAGIPFLNWFYLQRYDVFPALICLLALWMFCSGRQRLCGLAIAAGIGVKLYPVLFVPPLLILAKRQNKWKPFVVGLTVGLLPLAFLGFYLPWWKFAAFHAGRGLQAESIYASIIWLGRSLGLTQADWVWPRGYAEVHGLAATAVLPWARATFAVTVVFSTALTTWAAARIAPLRPAESVPVESAHCPFTVSQLAQLLLLPLLAFVAFNQVLSPQYMIWVLPMAALTCLGYRLGPGIAIALATALTPIIFPSLHGDYGNGLDLAETYILVARNLILSSAWLWLAHKSVLESFSKSTVK